MTDRSFSEFNVILCRNVLIYFDKTLQAKVHGLFYDSLVDVRGAGARQQGNAALHVARGVLPADRAAGKDFPEGRDRCRTRSSSIGTSWGGLAALRSCCTSLPGRFPIFRSSSCSTAARMRTTCSAQLLQDATDLQRLRDRGQGSAVEPGTVHIAPANYHVLVEDGLSLAHVDEPWCGSAGRRST